MKLDEKDLEILRMLERNARTSFRSIAKEIGLSPMAVVKRVRKMESEGVIKKYTIVINPDVLGYNCNLYILVRVKAGFDATEIGKKLLELPGTCNVNQITGDHDLVLMARCRDREEIGRYLCEINKMEGVERVNSYFIIRSIG